jgi:hypothetical protein
MDGEHECRNSMVASSSGIKNIAGYNPFLLEQSSAFATIGFGVFGRDDIYTETFVEATGAATETEPS